MRNKHGYTHIGGRLTVTRRVDMNSFLEQGRRAHEEAEKMIARGFVEGIHDELVFAAHPSWTDEELAALVREVRTPLQWATGMPLNNPVDDLRNRAVEKMRATENGLREQGLTVEKWVCTEEDGRILLTAHGIRTAVEQTQIVKTLCPVVDVVQGDQVFETAASDPVTVLYVHDADYFVSLMVVREGNAPFIIQRHSEAVIYKVVKS